MPFFPRVFRLSTGFRILAVVALSLPADGSLAQVPDERPNIVLCIADDWSWPHAGAYGDTVIRTPNFDRVANEGVLFSNAFCPSPSCTASRVSILTGLYPHRLNQGANLMARLPKSWIVYPEILDAAGYSVGKSSKGCHPGTLVGTAWPHDPAGPNYESFKEFLDSVPADKPFCFWAGSRYPHRPYQDGVGTRIGGMKQEDVVVPPHLPDTPQVRSDILDYYFWVQRFDSEVGKIIQRLEESDLLDNTIIVVTSDNGMPFPRSKATCYDSGTRVPLAIRWPKRIKAGQVSDAFVNLSDLAPTFLEAAGLDYPRTMTGQSLYGLLVGESPGRSTWNPLSLFKGRNTKRDRVFVERERHGLGRGGSAGTRGHLSYPIRAVRTEEFLYIRNFRPDLWPVCDPPNYKDTDLSPSRTVVLGYERHADEKKKRFYERAFAKRPAEELYDIRSDPSQLKNLAEDRRYVAVKKRLRAELRDWMLDTDDPRAHGEDDRWDYYGYYEGARPPVLFERPKK